MTDENFAELARNLTEAGNELYADLGFPATFGDFMCAMWQEDGDMIKWGATREEYKDALACAYDALTCGNQQEGSN